MMVNINAASKEQLVKLAGIGEAKAEKIITFRESGGIINNIEELRKIAEVQPHYLAALEAEIDFHLDENSDSLSFITARPSLDLISKPQISSVFPTDPYTPVKPLPLPLFGAYQFTVNFERMNNCPLPDLSGYQLLVGYRIGNVITESKTHIRERTKTYNLGKKPAITISIPKPFLPAAFLENEFELILLSPEEITVYRSSFEIDEGDQVTIGVPLYGQQTLEITWNKNVDYRGLSLELAYSMNRGASGIIESTKSFELGGEESLQVEFDTFGQVEKLSVAVYSNEGILVYHSKSTWAELGGTGNAKSIKCKLPMPEEIIFNVSLGQGLYQDHQLVANFYILDEKTLSTICQIEENYSITSEGKSKVKLAHYGLVKEITLTVYAPAGEVIGKKTIINTDWSDGGTITIDAPPRQRAGGSGLDETLPNRPKKTTGRAIDVRGKKKLEGIQIIIYASKVPNPQEADYVPLLVLQTETDGYFLFDTPIGYYEKAYAMVGTPKKGEAEKGVCKVDICLEPDFVEKLQQGGPPKKVEKKFFPGRLLLVIDAESESHGKDGGDCDDCKDLNFHRHKAVVDEFSYYTVVRTTEPDIQGYTLEEDGDVTLQKVLEVAPIVGEDANSIPLAMRFQPVRRSILNKYVNDRRGLTLTTLKKALAESNARKLRELIKPTRRHQTPGRHTLDLDHAIDWDKDPTIYQATTIAHGHLLHYKQEWKNNGFGIGDLLYSLPLAPGQQKQIVVFDWERRDSASRSESLDYQESLYNSLTRDRDVNEIVTGVLRESVRGGSTAKTSSRSGGLGIAAISGSVGGLLGIAGGSSKSSSTAWQDSSRNTALQDMQQIRDRTVQSANSVRSLRSTVVTTATQGERFSVETEVIANYNHCHSLTMQYFEVLRHMQVEVRLSSVQECLFIPLIMSSFDHQKILRWREPLAGYILDEQLRCGFDAIGRIENDYEGSDLPEGMYAEDEIEYWSGDLYIKFDIPCPADLELFEKKEELREALSPFIFWGSSIDRLIDKVYEQAANKRNEAFYRFVAPEIAAAIADKLRFTAVIRQESNEYSVELNVDTTLVSRFQNGQNHYISVRELTRQTPIKRIDIEAITIHIDASTQLKSGESIEEFLPSNTRIIVTSGSMNYRSKHYSGLLFKSSRINNDLVGYGGVSSNDYVRIPTPLSHEEMRNPRNEDLESADHLRQHLNDNLEYYHKIIWMNMSPERRFMFLDGIRITDYSEGDRYPSGVIRSVASVVENRVIGIAGNSLVMPVAPGFRLDPNTRGQYVDLLSLYQPLTPVEPINITIPTKGVFAEAVIGKCNSCEKIQNDRFWKWEEHPIPHAPTEIAAIGTESRRSAPLDTTPSSLPNPVVNIQNAPAIPDPTGLSAAANLLEQARFEDITGLTQNQQNALEALKASLSAAQAFGSKAGDMAALGAQLDSIRIAKENNLIGEDKARELSEKAIENAAAGGGTPITEGLSELKKVREMAKNGTITGDVEQTVTDAVVSKIKQDAQGKKDSDIGQIIDRGASLVGTGMVTNMTAKATEPDGKTSELTLASSVVAMPPTPKLILRRTGVEFEVSCPTDFSPITIGNFRTVCENGKLYYWDTTESDKNHKKLVKGYRSKLIVENPDGTSEEFDAIERANGFTHLKEGTYQATCEPRASHQDKEEILVKEAIFIHVANYPYQLHGCIAPGEIWPEFGVSNSTATLARINSLLGWESGKKIELVVKGYKEKPG
ncbi:MAG: helix-hairpin-helix domain-containing protein [Anaerolineae bacterium]|nr:helix-hairpin-helix domain-containing protein [Anaerolineae bacterium]